MENSLHIPLDLPDVRVLKLSKTEEGAWLIQIESTHDGTTCHKCGREITDLHCHDEAVRLWYRCTTESAPRYKGFGFGCAPGHRSDWRTA
jgi:hypothetical protein